MTPDPTATVSAVIGKNPEVWSGFDWMATALDSVTGEVFKQRLVPDSEVVVDWLRSLPGPVAATYEAGPTGLGL